MEQQSNEAGFLSLVSARCPGLSETEAARVAEAVMDALGEVLTVDEAALVGKYVPSRYGELITAAARRSKAEGDERRLVLGVAWRENVRASEALEHVTAVCDAIAELLAPEARAKLGADLPDRIGQLFARRDRGPAPHRERLEPQAVPNNLATGRPTSVRPISEARPERAQTESVVRSADPHGDTKLSETHGLTQERLGESIATGKPKR